MEISRDQLILAQSTALANMTTENPMILLISETLVEAASRTVDILFNEDSAKDVSVLSEYKYGDKVRDQVTGYVGDVTAKCDHFGKRPTQYLVEGKDSTGRPIEWWCDSERLSLFNKEDK